MSAHQDETGKPGILLCADRMSDCAEVIPSGFVAISVEEWEHAVNALMGEATGDYSIATREIIGCAIFDEDPGAPEALLEKMEIPLWQCGSIDAPDWQHRLLAHVASGSIARTVAARIHAATAQQQAALLRREFEELQRRFQSLEDFVYELGAPKFAVAFDAEPATGSVELAVSQGSAGELRQQLPVTARAIIGIDLHVTRVKADPAARLHVAFRDLGDTELGAIEAPLSDLVVGLNRLRLPAGLDTPDRDLVIALRIEGKPGDALAIACGGPAPLPQFQLQGAAENADGKLLALKLWRGLPGVRLPRPGASTRQDHDEGFVRAGDMPRPQLLSSSGPKMDFEPVQYWANEDGILVHPPTRGMTVALVRRVKVENLKRISAVINIAHAEAAPLSFAFEATPSKWSKPTPKLAYWTTLTAQTWGEINFEFDAPVTGEIDLVLAARVTEGNNNRFAWALFRGFRLWPE